MGKQVSVQEVSQDALTDELTNVVQNMRVDHSDNLEPEGVVFVVFFCNKPFFFSQVEQFIPTAGGIRVT